MITPSFSPTATERVLPRLALDFTTGVLDPRVTVTRALNTATRTNASGLIEIVNANLPRFDYDGATLAPKGLLIEESRANLFTYSEAFNGAGWTTGDASIDPNVVMSPDGTSNADKLVENTAAGVSHRVFQTFTTSATTYSVSVYTKQAGRIKLYIREGSLTGNYGAFDIANGTVLETVGATATITNVGNGWYRCTVVMGALAGSSRFDIGLLPDNWTAGSARTYTGNGVSGIYLYGAQLEAGAFATSYIPTTTTSLTRNADTVRMTGTNFSSWYTTAGNNETWTARILPRNLRNGDRIVAFDTGFAGASAYRGPILDTFDQLGAYDGTADRIFGGISGTGIRKLATAYSGSTMSGSINGSIAGSAFDGNMNPSTTLGIGSYAGAASGYINSWMQYLSYYPQRLTDRELQALTT